MQKMHSDSFWDATYFSSDRVLRLTRSSAAFPSTEAALASFRALGAVVDAVIADAKGLLMDVRSSPLRSDPAFEASSKAHLDVHIVRFARVAVLVATATGKLQVNRIKRERDMDLEVFDDERAARAFVTG
jgi:hypothetical protein